MLQSGQLATLLDRVMNNALAHEIPHTPDGKFSFTPKVPQALITRCMTLADPHSTKHWLHYTSGIGPENHSIPAKKNAFAYRTVLIALKLWRAAAAQCGPHWQQTNVWLNRKQLRMLMGMIALSHSGAHWTLPSVFLWGRHNFFSSSPASYSLLSLVVSSCFLPAVMHFLLPPPASLCTLTWE